VEHSFIQKQLKLHNAEEQPLHTQLSKCLPKFHRLTDSPVF